MSHSEQLNELAAALSKAQGEFGAVPKDSVNPFFKSSYADLAAVVRTASPVLSNNGLSITQMIGSDEQGDTLTTMLLHSSGQYIGGTMQLKPVKNDPQSQGSATTYARRYAYMAALGLVADNDDDGNTATKNTQPAKARNTTSEVRKPPTGAGVGEVKATSAMRQSLIAKAFKSGLDEDALSDVMEKEVGKRLDDAGVTFEDINKMLAYVADPGRAF